ncbi:unnamed protein product [Polarella glacialis]|uniref:40S ribosomal protein S15 n=2 Tax=Polarella glacialis TaxID=89957 RepID=A0A813DHK9_POLGL|nr:unnamed protein product [Polarella glacialis]
MDACSLDFQDECFHAVFDKATFDTIRVVEPRLCPGAGAALGGLQSLAAWRGDSGYCLRLLNILLPLCIFVRPSSGGAGALGLTLGGGSASSSSSASAVALTPTAAKLVEQAVPLLGVSKEVAEDLVRLLVDERLSGFSVLHYDGNVFDLLDLSPAASEGALQGLLHAERCEALQALAAVLRGAHDDSHVCAAQCRELAQKLLSEGLEDHLWQTYKKVSDCPKFESSPPHAEVVACVRQGLDLQLCVLECLLLAGYDPELSKSNPEQVCRMADLFFRQRFLGSLPRAAHHHHWLFGDADVCAQAQCVGDLSLALLLESLGLEEELPSPEVESSATSRHPLLGSPQHAQHLHRQFTTEWLQICEHAANQRDSAAAPAAAHCGRHVSLVVLGWASLLAGAPQAYREAHGLGFERLMASSVFKSRHLLRDAVDGIINRGFLTKDSPSAQHAAARAVLRGLIAGAAAGLARASFEGEVGGLQSLGLRSILDVGLSPSLGAFPGSLGGILEMLAGLAAGVTGGSAASSGAGPISAAMAEEDETKKKRTFRKYSYRGIDLDKLLDLSNQDLMELFRARQRRKFSRGIKRKPITVLKKLRKAKRDTAYGEKPEAVKTHLRNMVIVPEMIGSVVGVYNGKQYISVEIKPEMIGHYLGEFSITYKPIKHGRAGMGGKGAMFVPLS